MAEEHSVDGAANKGARGSEKKFDKRVSRRCLIDEPSLDGSTHNQSRGSKEKPGKSDP